MITAKKLNVLKFRDNKFFDELGKYNKTSKNLRNALIGVAGLTALGTGAYLTKKHYDKKRSEKKD